MSTDKNTNERDNVKKIPKLAEKEAPKSVSMTMSKEEKSRERRKLGGMLLKAVSAVLLVVIVAAGSVLIYAHVKNKKALEDEQKYLTPPGQMVEVNGHQIHVLKRGSESAEHTLVFIHSNKIADDSVALEPLMDELSDYELIYVDRSGVGYSEDWDAPKDIDSMLEETRTAVQAVTDSRSYVLVAYKNGGTLAMDWCDRYPDEVESVIGLQMYFPDQYDGADEKDYSSLRNKLMLELVKIGGHRLSDSVFPDNEWDVYTKDQMDRRDALIGRGLYTKGMYNEDRNLVGNANKVAALGWPENIPMYMIYCNPYTDPFLHQNDEVLESYENQADIAQDEDGNSVDPADVYNTYYKNYTEEHDNVEMTEVSGPDRMIVYNPQKIAELVQKYLSDKAE